MEQKNSPLVDEEVAVVVSEASSVDFAATKNSQQQQGVPEAVFPKQTKRNLKAKYKHINSQRVASSSNPAPIQHFLSRATSESAAVTLKDVEDLRVSNEDMGGVITRKAVPKKLSRLCEAEDRRKWPSNWEQEQGQEPVARGAGDEQLPQQNVSVMSVGAAFKGDSQDLLIDSSLDEDNNYEVEKSGYASNYGLNHSADHGDEQQQKPPRFLSNHCSTRSSSGGGSDHDAKDKPRPNKFSRKYFRKQSTRSSDSNSCSCCGRSECSQCCWSAEYYCSANPQTNSGNENGNNSCARKMTATAPAKLLLQQTPAEPSDSERNVQSVPRPQRDNMYERIPIRHSYRYSYSRNHIFVILY